MKRIFLALALLTALATQGIAQEASAKAAFEEGDYAASVALYQAAMTTAAGGDYTRVSEGLQRAKNCETLLSQGNSAYAAKRYGEAQKRYQALLKYNPTDPVAKQRLPICNRYVAQAQSKTRQQEKLVEALRSNSEEALNSYIKQFPNSDEAALASMILADEVPNDSLVESYLEIGNLYSKLKNSDHARKWYGKAASLASPEGLFRLALTYPDLNKQYPNAMLAMAYAGGYEPAKDKLCEVAKWAIDLSVAKELYKALKHCRTSLTDFVYAYVNKDFYGGIAELDWKEIASQLPAFDKQQAWDDDNLIVQYALILYKLTKTDMAPMMEVAATRGNVLAVNWIGGAARGLSVEEKRAFELYEETFASTDDKVKSAYDCFIKYLDKGELEVSEWSNLGYIFSYLDPHMKLLRYALCDMGKYTYKDFKKFLSEHKGMTWDADVVSYIIKHTPSYSPNYAKKIIKAVSKLPTATQVYDKTQLPTYKMFEAGYCTNRHYNRPPITKATLWIYPISEPSQLLPTEEELQVWRNDKRIFDYIKKHGPLYFSASRTAISNDGSTTFVVKINDDNQLVIGVTGNTGNGVSFSNKYLPLQLRNGKAKATEGNLRSCRYISFSANFELTDTELKFSAFYTTTASASFSASFSQKRKK